MNNLNVGDIIMWYNFCTKEGFVDSYNNDSEDTYLSDHGWNPYIIMTVEQVRYKLDSLR